MYICCQGLEKDGTRHIVRASRFPVFAAMVFPSPLLDTGFREPEQWVVSEHRHPLSGAWEKSHLSPEC